MNRIMKHSSLLLRPFTSSTVAPQAKHKVLIVGVGSAGASMANRLSKKIGEHNVAAIEPLSDHYYQPLWTLVGAGICDFKDSVRSVKQVIPTGVKLYQDKITKVEPTNSYVVLSDGTKIYYEYLILALGMTLRFDKITGAEEALQSDPRVCSNYCPEYVMKTYEAYKNFQNGKALFTLPEGAIKCAGAPQKVMYLFDDYLQKQGTRSNADVLYFTALNKLFSVDKYANKLSNICEQRNITYNLSHNLIEVDSSNSEAIFQNSANNTQKRVKFDFLHITPPMTVPDVLKATPKLTNPNAGDYVDVDIKTLRHLQFPNVFALGDCAALPTSKTAAAIASQALVVEMNLFDVMNGGSGNIAQYDGYTACPLITGYNRGIIAEFDYTMQPLETFPLDQGKENYLHYFVKTTILPSLYWDWFICGLWSGPAVVRKLLHLGKGR